MQKFNPFQTLFLILLLATGTHGFFNDDELCLRVKQGNQNSGPNLFLHWFRGLTWRNNAFAFRFDDYTPYNMGEHCQTQWNELWGRSRCGFFQRKTRDSSNFGWRVHPEFVGKIQLAALQYDHGVTPESQPGTLEKTFIQVIEPGVQYITSIVDGLDVSTYNLYASNGILLESLEITPENQCRDFMFGAMDQLDFGGDCPAPNRVEVCFSQARDVL
jgi:hypothetical protein